MVPQHTSWYAISQLVHLFVISIKKGYDKNVQHVFTRLIYSCHRQNRLGIIELFLKKIHNKIALE